jgi:aspartate beta-hydroxylase
VSRRPGDDERAERLIRFLETEGAAARRHAGDRTLLEHLIDTYAIVGRWGAPVALQHAALIHSVYGTEAYHERLIPLSRRAEVASLAGEPAERLAYLFCATPRKALFAGTHLWARAVGPDPATREELDSVVLLHMANIAEQARAGDGSPGAWLVKVRELGELLVGSDAVTPPLFVAQLAAFSEEDESVARGAYRAGVYEVEGDEARINQLALAAATCPVVAEPCIWLAYLSHCRGEGETARSWARRARERLLGLGTCWDKRLTFEQWLELARVLEQTPALRPASAIADPHALFEALTAGAARATPAPPRGVDPAAARARFERYVESLAAADGPASLGIYPALDSRPWHDPDDFPLTAYLRSHFKQIQSEILALEPSRFHRESERIGRAGKWDVAFFYERGRRRDAVCDACPVTTYGIESCGGMRTLGGLIYVSRMRAGTHIRAHRGPTNLRVRCHLGIVVPEGDCAIRVGAETRRWSEGDCLVFDDYFEHEAWNHTAKDRIVLIVDLWHPGLAPIEVRLLEGLQGYAYAYARQLNRYWSSNAAAAAGASGGA